MDSILHHSPTPSAFSAEPPGKGANSLIREKSPYLLQHAYNPVDWYPWGEEAFEKATREDKPVFLSVGYSTCHWCHVMEHESFEDHEMAAAMNETFVAVKVDREERPDIDHLYMTVCQMMTKGGGWPLTIILTPDKKPFFAATYLPKENRFGRMGLMELTYRIREFWTQRRSEVLQSAESVAGVLAETAWETPGGDLDEKVLQKAFGQFRQVFDGHHGGFGSAPKFPTPHNLTFLLRYWKRSGDPWALQMVEQTLQAMRSGGIFDHAGFGFHRYSTDREWLVPHFEKMLYDQALLCMAYLEAYQATGDIQYRKTAEEVFTYVLRDMTSPDGAFYCAEDADSEGVEGKFYVWSYQELRDVVGPEDADLVTKAYNVLPEGNHMEEATGHKTGTNILHLNRPISTLAAEIGVAEGELVRRLEGARQRLFETRERRVHCHKDDKVLTDWNGFMIAALAKAAAVLGDPRYVLAAAKAVDFILERLRDDHGRLLHRYRDGEAQFSGCLDDYTHLVWGLLELYEATFESRYLRVAEELNLEMLARFWDSNTGGLFFSPSDGEELIVRKKEVYDGATPSGNSVAALNLMRLARITGNPRLEQRAAEIFRAFSGSIREFPMGYTQMLCAVDLAIGPAHEVVVVGEPEADDTRQMINAIRGSFLPGKVVVLRPMTTPDPDLLSLIPFIRVFETVNGKATAYVCRNHTCEVPTTDPNELLRLLERVEVP